MHVTDRRRLEGVDVNRCTRDPGMKDRLDRRVTIREPKCLVAATLCDFHRRTRLQASRDSENGWQTVASDRSTWTDRLQD